MEKAPRLGVRSAEAASAMDLEVCGWGSRGMTRFSGEEGICHRVALLGKGCLPGWQDKPWGMAR